MDKLIINRVSLILTILLFVSLLILSVLVSQGILFLTPTHFSIVVIGLFGSLIVYSSTV
jgi:hypothetical protein